MIIRGKTISVNIPEMTKNVRKLALNKGMIDICGRIPDGLFGQKAVTAQPG